MKVRIYNNQIVPENPSLVVLSPTGDYGPFDLIECGESGGAVAAAFQAQYVKFGGVVYREQEYIEVLSKLGLVDLKPDTLSDMLTSDKTAIVIDRDPLDTLPADPVPQPDLSTVDTSTFATTTETIDTPSSEDVQLPDVVSFDGATTTATTTPEFPNVDILPPADVTTDVATSTP